MTTDTTVEAALQALYADLDAADLQPLWTITSELLTPTPQPKAVPWLWPASVLTPLAARALDLVPVDRGGERRVLSLRNPGLGGKPYVAGTLWAAIQCLGPGETAPAHRHTPGAIRFVTQGSGVWTTVNGDACDMAEGDLVLTPSWTWHDHNSTSDEPMLWFDGLDLPMIEALDAIFFEPHPEFSQPVGQEHNQSEQRYGTSDRRLAVPGRTLPTGPTPSPLLIYRWADTDRELTRLAAERDEAMTSLEFTHVETGGSVLPTLSCSMHRLAADRPTRPMRRAGNHVYVVFRGRGHSVVDGKRMDWEQGDIFVVPSWAAAEHAARDADADLFCLSDTPVLRALGIYREEEL